MIEAVVEIEVPYFRSPEPLCVTLEEAVKVARTLVQANSKIRLTVYLDWVWKESYSSQKEVDDFFWQMYGLDNPSTDLEDIVELIKILNDLGVPVVRGYFSELCSCEELVDAGTIQKIE